ncbi:NAD+ synthase [Bradyrhizobium sp. U87765 SZCCT0131]|uniref:NAD+ synthase n=1 Tax=unclassified Bradyrhizobium TaxID=2631580 RepID=UPI001BA577D6|nr:MULTISPECIES: NAD+ synthase [unclassified Bradyrhizobium]MBR1221442.1 NAD+ synthase [Bradyrhizobium sp. U87765 SZCCT0131]MBR1264635.1 NAD+ synthase [Bradyrhizobium sp. U87765 SZCCT0134]MBR1304459.1 NAD+ synthase [Bradyrhizobium sp. U87765 SZCCT0110]MBR1322684.1 NAD+ synthase [Bradyrhizobium sp. U87765 SZCCT0109]MBR1346388.1 NAD+ synthase [Bradyrhizobium sp. U87765 SZCCT0048]
MTTVNSFVVALAQLNPVVGDIAGNAARARQARARAAADGADLVVFSELFIAGYPPEDLVLKPAFQAACRAAIEALARETADGGPAMLIGTPWVDDGKLYNACALLDGGRIAALRFKANLPNYGVFDEKRVFARGPASGPVTVRGVRIGVPICEDTWMEESADYENVVECLAETGAEILIVPNGSPYARGKADMRLSMAVARVTESDLPLVYLNQVGGQDELVFDGGSFVLHADRTLAAQLPAFAESLVTLRWTRSGDTWRCAGPVAPPLGDDEADYAACVLGLRDYVDKNGFPGILLGVSGGIDSALCAAIAVDALGADRVRGVMLPYRFTAAVSRDDAAALAAALGFHCDVLPIAAAVEGFEQVLAVPFAGLARDVTEENLQARTRGVVLMALSNKTGAMLVTTGNKSEMSVGYATLYGDMNGGFNPIKDLYKTQVFRLSQLRNRWTPEGARGPAGVVIPERIITRPPTAELREDQRDQDTLPPYDVLDGILERLIEREEPLAAIITAGFDRDTVVRVERLLNVAEYKRRQAAPGVKVTARNFGRGRRYPITNRFSDTAAPLPAPDDSLVTRASRGSVTYDE